MKTYIEERAIEIANYMIENNATVRQAAKNFGISKSTVHKDVTERLEQINPALAAEARKVIDSFSELEICMTQNWNKRYRENMDKLKSGDLLEVASVVKGLMCRDNERGLSTGERKMLHSAKQILISELVIAMSENYEQIEKALSASI